MRLDVPHGCHLALTTELSAPGVFARLANMHVEMAVTMPAMRVARCLDLVWHGDQPSVAHPALGGDVIGEMTDVVHRAAQYCDLEAALVVEMHMHRRQRQIAVVVEGTGQPLGERARPS